MALLRGKGTDLEITLADRDAGEALLELERRLSERPDFYRGASAVLTVGKEPLSVEALSAIEGVLRAGGVTIRALRGPREARGLAERCGMAFEESHREEVLEEIARRRRDGARVVRLSEKARSLVPDFEGARADIARRRKRGESSVPRLEVRPVRSAPQGIAAADARTHARYHRGTVRGGQSLHEVGHLVVVGDVNPGAELVATGDVVVFGRLAGVAHAGARGDTEARIYALEMRPTQVRIGAYIAADADERRPSGPEVALVRDGRIVIVPAANGLDG